MKNGNFSCHDIKHVCEKKLGIIFRNNGEFNGWVMWSTTRIARITIPHGRKFLPPKTYQSMAHQLKISVPEFDEFLACPLTRDRYFEILKEKNIIA